MAILAIDCATVSTRRADSWLPKRSLLSGITGIDRESYAHTYYMALYSYLRDYNFITHVA